MDLADRIIQNNSVQEKDYQEFGIDELGLPVPYPINTSYIVARIIGSDKNLFKVGDRLYLDKRYIPMRASYVKMLCGEPRIVLWKNDEMRDKWKNPSSFIGNNFSIIWDKLMKYVPEYDRRYIEVVKGLIWDKEKSDFIVKGEL